MGITLLARAWREVNYKFHISRSNSTILKSNSKLFWNERIIYDMANRKEEGKGQEERKRNRVTTRPRTETNYACGSNLRRRKYASNAFKVNCISLCRARIVCSSPRRVTMHNTRKSARHTYTRVLSAHARARARAQDYKKRRKERERAKKWAGGREGERRGSLRAHENCMENKLHGQREHSCERITRAMAFAQYASVLHM